MSFHITIDRRSTAAAVVAVAGDLDLAAAPQLRTHLVELVDAGAREVVVDLTETTFLDSTSLGALVGGVKRLRSVGGELSLVCTDRSLVRIFEITGLDRVFSLHRTLEEALAAAALPAPIPLPAAC